MMKRSIAWLSVVALVFSSIHTSPSLAQSGSERYTQNASGLEKQFEPFLKAYSDGDVAAQEQAFAVFQFPDGRAWFWEYFRPEDVEQVLSDSHAAVDLDKKGLRMGMDRVARGARFHANCEPQAEKKEPLVKPRASSLNPVKAVAVEQFLIKVSEKRSGKWFSYLGNFVYVDGAYRYVGGGVLPFWSMPGGAHPKKD
jgi:hypothetical protein